MITTPLGTIEIYLDDRKMEYREISVAVDPLCPNLDGRFKIEITFMPDGLEHTISCIVNSNGTIIDNDIESGERLECQSFFGNNVKLSIGAEGEDGYYGPCEMSDYLYDYDCTYLSNGLSYDIFNFTKTNKFVFGIAWINDPSTEKRDVQTWYGADPSIL